MCVGQQLMHPNDLGAAPEMRAVKDYIGGIARKGLAIGLAVTGIPGGNQPVKERSNLSFGGNGRPADGCNHSLTLWHLSFPGGCPRPKTQTLLVRFLQGAAMSRHQTVQSCPRRLV